MTEPTTIKGIIDYVQEKVSNHVPFSPAAFLDIAHKMTALMGELDEELIESKMFVNRKMAELSATESAAKVKILVQALPEYERYLKLEALRKQAEEFIRLAKKRVQLQSFDQ